MSLKNFFGFFFAFVMAILIVTGATFSLMRLLNIASTAFGTSTASLWRQSFDFGLFSYVNDELVYNLGLITDGRFHFFDLNAFNKVLLFGILYIPTFIIDVLRGLVMVCVYGWRGIIQIVRAFL